MSTIASQNHQPHSCLLNRLFRRRSKKTSKLRVTGLCAGNSPGTSNAENVSIWWRHHECGTRFHVMMPLRETTVATVAFTTTGLGSHQETPDYCPANTQRNKHVIIMPKHRFDIIITCLLRLVFAGGWPANPYCHHWFSRYLVSSSARNYWL